MTAVKEVSNATKRIYRKGTGTGTAADPFVQSMVVDSPLPAGTNQIGNVVPKVSANYSATLPFTFKRTLVADTDQSIDVPTGTKFVVIYHVLATPVHAVLEGAVTIPVAGAAGQHTILFPPNSPMAYALWDTPTAVDTHDLHVRSASAGDIWVSFVAE